MNATDGLEATQRMRHFEGSRDTDDVRRPRIPIIALSGNAMKEQVQQAMDTGTSDYLIKPCKQADLRRTLKYWEHVVHTGAPHRPMELSKRPR